ncbi:MAG: glycosyl hydrolase, partial [Candidatus Cloacimonetes bacterium]|nr:glycosyl hydrolase [Candidatus Cloacimonadota bacterium]
MIKNKVKTFVFIILLISFFGCGVNSSKKLNSTSEILLTSAEGDILSKQNNVEFQIGNAQGNVIRIYPEIIKQTIDGIGSSFTESSAFVLAHLDEQTRQEVMENIFGEAGADFTLSRT